MKKVKALSVILLITALLIICGSVGAYMRKQTRTIENVFLPAQVSCYVHETFSDNVKSSIKVENTGTIEAYIRLRIVTYWVDSNGDVLAREPKTLNVNYDTDKWMKIDDIYYYKEPVAAQGTTSEFLKGNITLIQEEDVNDKTIKIRQVVEVFAEAIQSLPEEAVTSSWDAVKVNNNQLEKK